MKNVVIMKSRQLIIIKSRAFCGLIIPAGISRTAVLGLEASYLASSQRLKAIAAERAKTMQSTTSKKYFEITNQGFAPVYNCSTRLPVATVDKTEVCHPGITVKAAKLLNLFKPIKKPTNAKGIAKMVWENLMRER